MSRLSTITGRIKMFKAHYSVTLPRLAKTLKPKLIANFTLKSSVCQKEFGYSLTSNRAETARTFVLIFDTFNSGLFGLAYLAALGIEQKEWTAVLNEDFFSQSEFERLCESMEIDLPSQTVFYSEAALRVDISIASAWGSIKNRKLLRSQIHRVTTFWKKRSLSPSTYVVCGNTSLRFGFPLHQRARMIRVAHGLLDELARMRTFKSLWQDVARSCLQSLFFGLLKTYGGLPPYPRFACLAHQCTVASKIDLGYRSLSSGRSLASVDSTNIDRTALLLLPSSVFRPGALEIWWQRTHEVLRGSLEADSVLATRLLIKPHPSISDYQFERVRNIVSHLAQQNELQAVQVVCRKIPAEVLVREAKAQIVCGSVSLALVYCAFQPSVSEVFEIEPDHLQPREIGSVELVRPPALETPESLARDWVVSQEKALSGLILTSGLHKFMPADYSYYQKSDFPISKAAN